MIIDNLTYAGLIAASAYLLMPLLMGRELIKVEGDGTSPRDSSRRVRPPLQPAAGGCARS
jgi:hypothetical protein